MMLLKRRFYRIAYALMRVYWSLFRPQTRGSYVALWQEGRILVILNSYKSVWTLPCGGPKGQETPVETALRELREETGIALEPSQLEWAGSFLSRVEYKRDHIDLFEAHLDGPTAPKVCVDGVEVVDARYVTVKQALQMPLFPVLREYLETRSDTASREQD